MIMAESILLIGGGGHAKSIIDTLSINKEMQIIGILDREEKVGEVINGIKIIGTDEQLADYYHQGVKYAFISIGSIGLPKQRKKVYEQIKTIGYSFPNIIDHTAILSSKVRLGEGNYIGKGAVVNAGTVIGSHCIINTGCIVEHDCRIEDFVHLATGSVLCGGVQIGEGAHVGAHSTIIQYKKIGNNSLIGAGSVVVSDINGYAKAYGNPCREVGRVE